MKFSIAVPESHIQINHGYGVAANGMISTLRDLGHEVNISDPAAPVEIAFIQPDYWEWSNPNAHHIGYVPWESTRLPDKWIAPMQKADEVWTTSQWCKRVFDKNGIGNVKVYHHGVDQATWARKRRRVEERPLRFLHIGEPAPRKGGQLVYDAFMAVFGDSGEQATLTIKAHHHNSVRGPEIVTIGTDGNIYMIPENRRSSVQVISGEMPEHELVDLVRRHDVLVYPSWGEGFGLIPLQAMVTGMPVICPTAWAPYSHLLVPELALPSKLAPSPWPDMHPGNMYEPDAEALKNMMRNLTDPANFMKASVQAYARSFDVEREFDWLALTQTAFAPIIKTFG
jgi:glycosyltransferase involved in cell wall biosynthesis